MTLKFISVPPSAGSVAKGAIVILHGWGANAEDAAYFMGLLDLGAYHLVFPEAPFEHPAPGGKMWYGFPPEFNFVGTWGQLPQLQASRQELLTFLTTLPTLTGVPLMQTILGGFSQGGAMTIEVGFEFPLAGRMILSGYRHNPIAPISDQAPVLMVHGAIDSVVPVRAAVETRDRLIEAGAQVRYLEFSTLGHEVSQAVLGEMNRFIRSVYPVGI
jgi:phospholipase/carboxylesterase